jgi:hypothetical protein
LSSKDNSQFSKILLSTSLFTADFKPENEKSNFVLSSQTRGKRFSSVCSFLRTVLNSYASLEIIGQPGYPSHIIFATLS